LHAFSLSHRMCAFDNEILDELVVLSWILLCMNDSWDLELFWMIEKDFVCEFWTAVLLLRLYERLMLFSSCQSFWVSHLDLLLSESRFHKKSVFICEQKDALSIDLDLNLDLEKFWESLSVRLSERLFQNLSYQLDVDHSFWLTVVYEMWLWHLLWRMTV